jgi:glycosyltransferase involved in cell wall biosynthesis
MKNKIFIADDNLPYLLTDFNYPVGGASVQAFSWYHGLKSFYDIKIISNNKINNSSDNIITYKSSSIPVLGTFINIKRLNKIVKKENPKAVFVTVSGLNAFIWGVLCRLNKLFYIQRISNNIVYKNKVYRRKIGLIKYLLSRIGIKYSNLILCQNNVQINNLKTVTSNHSQIKKIYNPFYINHKLSKNNNKHNYVAWIGIFQYQKNMKELYNIAKKMPNTVFKIAGTMVKNPDKETVDYVSKLKKLNNVNFVGLLNRVQIFSFLSESKCLLNTSRYEGFSNTFLEAFSTNTPIITTPNIDPDGIIKRHSLGLIANEYNDIPGLIDSIMLMSNSDVLDKFDVYKYVSENHNHSKLAKEVHNYINNYYETDKKNNL